MTKVCQAFIQRRLKLCFHFFQVFIHLQIFIFDVLFHDLYFCQKFIFLVVNLCLQCFISSIDKLFEFGTLFLCCGSEIVYFLFKCFKRAFCLFLQFAVCFSECAEYALLDLFDCFSKGIELFFKLFHLGAKDQLSDLVDIIHVFFRHGIYPSLLKNYCKYYIYKSNFIYLIS